MDSSVINQLRNDLSLRAKNGINFILAASIVWALIAYLWTLPASAYSKSVYTFIAGALLLPLAFLFAKVLKAEWKIEGNPLAPLGLWLNFAQLFYFPFLVFVLMRYPQHFIMAYAIITGAHFFPYAWFYRATIYAAMAGIISVGAMLGGLLLPEASLYFIPLGMSITLLILFSLLYLGWKKLAQASGYVTEGYPKASL